MRAKSRNSRIKALGMAAIAMVALSAMAASAAQAHVFKSAAAPAVLTGTNAKGTEHSFTIEGSVISCEDTHSVATQATEEAESLTVVPLYANGATEAGKCEAFGSAGTVTIGHCAYVLSGETEETTTGQAHAHVDLECAEGSEMAIEAPAAFVTLRIPAQTATTHGVRYYNLEEEYAPGETAKAVTVEATVKNIAMTCTGLGCALLGGREVSAETSAKEIITGYEDSSKEAVAGTAATTQASYSHGTAPIDIEVEGAPSK